MHAVLAFARSEGPPLSYKDSRSWLPSVAWKTKKKQPLLTRMHVFLLCVDTANRTGKTNPLHWQFNSLEHEHKFGMLLTCEGRIICGAAQRGRFHVFCLVA